MLMCQQCSLVILFITVIDCGPPGIFPNGYIEVHSTFIGSVIRFFCFDSMVYEGVFNSSTCTANGTWSPYPFPNCLGKFNSFFGS